MRKERKYDERSQREMRIKVWREDVNENQLEMRQQWRWTRRRHVERKTRKEGRRLKEEQRIGRQEVEVMWRGEEVGESFAASREGLTPRDKGILRE